MSRERATELEWLRWYACEADFGPAHGDVYEGYQMKFMLATGKNLPLGWEMSQDGETTMDQPEDA